MLTPTICATCEKVIFDQQIGLPRVPGTTSGPASLIGLFSKILFTVPPGGPEIPANAVAPREWAIYSEWNHEPGDEKRSYFLRAQVTYPNGEPFGAPTRIPINVNVGTKSQVLVRVPGFPIGQVGIYKIQVWIEENERRVSSPIDLEVEVVIAKQENTAH